MSEQAGPAAGLSGGLGLPACLSLVLHCYHASASSCHPHCADLPAPAPSCLPPGVYKNEEIPRVPVVCTGNDFSTLYAPLIRDGRMEKYYWK